MKTIASEETKYGRITLVYNRYNGYTLITDWKTENFHDTADAFKAFRLTCDHGNTWKGLDLPDDEWRQVF